MGIVSSLIAGILIFWFGGIIMELFTLDGIVNAQISKNRYKKLRQNQSFLDWIFRRRFRKWIPNKYYHFYIYSLIVGIPCMAISVIIAKLHFPNKYILIVFAIAWCPIFLQQCRIKHIGTSNHCRVINYKKVLEQDGIRINRKQ